MEEGEYGAREIRLTFTKARGQSRDNPLRLKPKVKGSMFKGRSQQTHPDKGRGGGVSERILTGGTRKKEANIARKNPKASRNSQMKNILTVTARGRGNMLEMEGDRLDGILTGKRKITMAV